MSDELPEPWGVLYAAPNKDGERKSCGNCRFFRKPDACSIVTGPVSAEMICGYHIESGQKTDPKLSGLTTVPGGTSCDTCYFYESKSDETGVCHGVEVNGKPAKVQAKGCCARWEEE